MAADNLEVTLRINADGSGLTAVLKTAQSQVDQFASGVTKSAGSAASGIGQIGAAAKGIAPAIAAPVAAASASLGQLSGSASGVSRELAIMTGEALRGNFTRLIGSTTVLANKFGLLAGLVSPAGAAFAAFGGIIGVMAYQTIQAQKTLDTFNKSIAGTNGYALQSATGMVALADNITKIGISSGDAQKEVLVLGSSGKFAGDQLGNALTGAANLSILLGVKIGDAGKEIEKLGDAPLKGLIAINNQTHLISLSAIAATASAEAMGDKFLAVSIATEAVADATTKAVAAQKAFNVQLSQASEQDALVRTIAGLDSESISAVKAAEAERLLNQARNLPNLVAIQTVADLIPQLQKEIDKVDMATATYGLGKVAIAQYTAAKLQMSLITQVASASEETLNAELKQGIPYAFALADSIKSGAAAYASTNSVLQVYLQKLINGAQAEDDLSAAAKARQKALAEEEAAIKKVADEEDSLRAIIDAGSSSLSAISKAQKDYDDGVKKLLDTEDNFNKTGKESTDQLNLLDAAYVQLNVDKTTAIQKANDILAVFYQEGTALDVMNKKYQDTIAALQDFTGLRDKEVLESKMAAEAETAWAESIHQALRAGDTDLAEWIKENHDGFIQAAKDNADYLYDTQNMYARIKQVRQDAINITESGLDSLGTSIASFATGSIKTWKDFGNALVQDTQQFIAAVIAEFLKLAVFNGIINSLFGLTGTSGELPTLANLAAAGSSSSGGLMSLLSGGGSAASGASGLASIFGGGGASLASSGSIAGGGAYTLVPLSGAGSAPLASAGAIPGGGEYVLGNTAAPAAPFGGTIGGFSTGGLLGAAGGALYGSTLGSGGISTAASTITGAVAGYAVGAAVTTAMTAGISAGLAAVPVVGWIALAALVVDKVSGGKLFGTKFQTQSTDTQISLGATGGTASATETQTRQKALFGGKETRVKDIDPGSDADAAATQLYTQEKAAITTQAQILGKTAGDLVAGTFDTITTYTKKGAVASTKTISDFFGKQYTEDATAFAQRYAAENTIALLDQGDAAQTVSKLADQYRGVASSLLDAATTMFAVTVDLKNGNNILNETGATLTESFEEIQKFNVAGEALTDTYARLVSETQNLTSLFTDTGNSITKTGDDFVSFADALATSFGGVANEGTALSQFVSEFGQIGNGAINQLTGIWTSANTQLVAIGETAGETTKQFALDFAAALPTLTPDEIATWVAAGNALYQATTAQDAYNNSLRSYQDFSAQLGISAGTQSAYEDTLVKIDQTMQDNIAQANSLAQAAGMAGASEQDLANIQLIASQSAAAALATLEQSTLDLINTLGLSTGGASGAAQSASSSFNSVATSANKAADAAKSLYDAQIAAIKAVKDFLNSSLLDTTVTTLTPQEQLEAAASIYQSTLAGADSGNADDMANLTKTAQDYLDAARTFYSSSDSYTAIFNAVRDGLSDFASKNPNKPDVTGTGASSSTTTGTTSAAASISPLQLQLNLQQLVGDIKDLIVATGKPLSSLVSTLGLNLPQLVKELGIDTGSKTVSTTEQLAALAQQMGIPLSQLTQQLGFSIGDLTDKQSLQSQALHDQITKLPANDSKALEPLFDAIAQATTSTDANAAIQTLTNYVNTLPESEKEQLAPYLAGVSLSGPLDYLTDINDSGTATAKAVTAIANAYKKPIMVTMVSPGTQVPGTGGTGGTGAGAGSGSGAGAGGSAGPVTGGSGVGPPPGGGNPVGPTMPVTNGVGISILQNANYQSQAAMQTNALLTSMLAEIRALRTDSKTDPTVSKNLDKVANKLDAVKSSSDAVASAITRQTDFAKNRR